MQIDSQDLQNPQAKPSHNPAVCTNCGKDNNSQSLPLLAGLPVCPQCENFFRHRPFPNWVKFFLLFIAFLVVFASVWNLRFVKAYIQMEQSIRYFQSDPSKTAALMTSASNLVPESTELRGWSAFYQGINLLHQDNNIDALKVLNAAKTDLQNMDQGIMTILDGLIEGASIGAAFDNKDYDQFLKLSSIHCAKNPDDPIACAQVASACACKFIATGEINYKTDALAHLEKAKSLANNSPDYLEYEQRILHRLHSGEIITKPEFYEKFPNGWNPPDDQAKE